MRSDDKRWRVYVEGYFVVHAPTPEEAIERAEKLRIEPDFIKDAQVTGHAVLDIGA